MPKSTAFPCDVMVTYSIVSVTGEAYPPPKTARVELENAITPHFAADKSPKY